MPYLIICQVGHGGSHLQRIVEMTHNESVDAGIICGLCSQPANAKFHRDFVHCDTGVALSHNYCSEVCKQESYEFQPDDNSIAEDNETMTRTDIRLAWTDVQNYMYVGEDIDIAEDNLTSGEIGNVYWDNGKTWFRVFDSGLSFLVNFNSVEILD